MHLKKGEEEENVNRNDTNKLHNLLKILFKLHLYGKRCLN